MGAPQIPKIQQDALPLQTVAQAVGGDSQLIGTVLVRFFSPDVLGCNAVSRTDFVNGATHHFAVLTNFLDLRGCNRYTILVQRTTDDASSAPAITPTHQIVMQYRMGVGVVPPFANAGGGDIFLAKSFLTITPTAFPAMSVGTPQVYLQSWSSNQIQGNAGVAASIGYDVRVGITWGVTDPDLTGGVHERFTLQLWAQN